MAEHQYRTLTKRTVDRLSVNGKDAVFWDNELPGFGDGLAPTPGNPWVFPGKKKGTRLVNLN